jgi:hypothetical protein
MEIKENYEPTAVIKETYEPPALVEVGGFAEKTLGVGSAYSEGPYAHRLFG